MSDTTTAILLGASASSVVWLAMLLLVIRCARRAMSLHERNAHYWARRYAELEEDCAAARRGERALSE